jgi:hypothetical protein
MLEHPSIRRYSRVERSDKATGADNQQERPTHLAHFVRPV